MGQIPWIVNRSIRDNITMGKPFHQRRFKEIVKLCELETDLLILPNGDATEIGERGINLSGG